MILKEIRYPAVSASEEPAIVRFQTTKELTTPAEEVAIDYLPRQRLAAKRRNAGPSSSSCSAPGQCPPHTLPGGRLEARCSDPASLGRSDLLAPCGTEPTAAGAR